MDEAICLRRRFERVEDGRYICSEFQPRTAMWQVQRSSRHIRSSAVLGADIHEKGPRLRPFLR